MDARRKQLGTWLGICVLLALAGLGLMEFAGSQSVGDVGFFAFLAGTAGALVLALLLGVKAVRSSSSR